MLREFLALPLVDPPPPPRHVIISERSGELSGAVAGGGWK